MKLKVPHQIHRSGDLKENKMCMKLSKKKTTKISTSFLKRNY